MTITQCKSIKLTKSFTIDWQVGLENNMMTSKNIIGTIKVWKNQKRISGSINKKHKLKGVKKLKNTKLFNKKKKLINLE